MPSASMARSMVSKDVPAVAASRHGARKRVSKRFTTKAGASAHATALLPNPRGDFKGRRKGDVVGLATPDQLDQGKDFHRVEEVKNPRRARGC